MKWVARLRAWWRRPVQLELPYACAYYGESCGPYYHLNSGFYGRCAKCGETYNPVNDR